MSFSREAMAREILRILIEVRLRQLGLTSRRLPDYRGEAAAC